MCVAMTAPAAAATAAGGVLGGIGLSKYMRSRKKSKQVMGDDAYHTWGKKRYGFRKITKKGSDTSTINISVPYNTTYQQSNTSGN